MLTQAKLKEALHYNPETGIFTWVKLNNNQLKPNALAGNLSPRGYIVIRIYAVLYKAHRLAWLYVYGDFPPKEIDHINHIKNDNRIVNLRLADRITNNRNASKRKDNTSGVVGVTFHKRVKKWQASIGAGSKHLGYFKTMEDAIFARKQAEITLDYHTNHGG